MLPCHKGHFGNRCVSRTNRSLDAFIFKSLQLYGNTLFFAAKKRVQSFKVPIRHRAMNIQLKISPLSLYLRRILIAIFFKPILFILIFHTRYTNHCSWSLFLILFNELKFFFSSFSAKFSDAFNIFKTRHKLVRNTALKDM